MTSRATRNNNPANIKVPSGGLDVARERYGDPNVSIDPVPASDGGNFLKFSDPKYGAEATTSLLKSPVYSGLTVDQAMKKWSGGGYGGNIDPSIANKTIAMLSPQELQSLTQKSMPIAESGSPTPGNSTSENSGGNTLAQKIKAKYPQYQDIPDNELTKKILAKYPQYQDMASGGQSSDSSAGYGNFPHSVLSPTDVTGNTSTQTQTPQDQGLAGKLNDRIGEIGNIFNQDASRKIDPFTGTLQTVGQIAGGVNDVAQAGLELIPGVKQAEGLLGNVVGAAANTGVGKAVIGAGQNFAQQHPTIAGDIGAVGNIAGAAGLLTGAGAIKDVAGGLISKALGKDALESTIADVSPELGSRAGARSVARQGTTKSLIKGEIKTVAGQSERDIGQTVNDEIPGFNKLKTFSDKVNAVRDKVYQLADDLKQKVISSGQDRIYSFKELNSAFNKLEPGIEIKGDTIALRKFNLAKEAALKIAQEQGGTISSLFDARKAFDQLVLKDFPTLYERANAPMRDAITSIRGEMNNFIEKNLPEGTGFKDSLQTQSRLFRAIDNMAPKSFGEVGTTRAGRWMGNHPVVTGLLKKGVGAAVTGSGVVGVPALYNHFMGQKN